MMLLLITTQTKSERRKLLRTPPVSLEAAQRELDELKPKMREYDETLRVIRETETDERRMAERRAGAKVDFWEVRVRHTFLLEFISRDRRGGQPRRDKRGDDRGRQQRTQSRLNQQGIELLRRCRATLSRFDDELEDGLDPDELRLLRDLESYLGH